MEKFTNTSLTKERKRLTRNILLGILVLAVAVAMAVWGYWVKYQAEKNVKPLNDIIINEDDEKEGKIATIDVQVEPYLFAEQEGNLNGFFIVMDSKYMYIVYMSKYDELTTKEDLKTNPVTITGATKLISKDIKELALKAYNKNLEEEYQLTMADFDSYFGDVYLDVTSSGISEIGNIQLFLAFIISISGVIGLIVAIIQKVKFSSGIKKMDETTIETLDNEMNSQDAFYYEKIHLYLTNNYIINFKGSFKVIEYRDIIWMYSMIYRTNGIKTNQSIKVMTKDGKTHEIAAIDIATKTKKEIYEEIWNTIIAKNNTIILGYTKEAQEEAQDRIEK